MGMKQELEKSRVSQATQKIGEQGEKFTKIIFPTYKLYVYMMICYSWWNLTSVLTK